MKYLEFFFFLVMVSCNNSKSTSNSPIDIDIVGNYEVVFIAEIENTTDKNITINFDVDGKVNGNNSCNNYGGNYKTENNELSFGMMMATRKYCQENAEIETTFMRNINEVDGFKIQGDILILLSGNTHVIEARNIKNK